MNQPKDYPERECTKFAYSGHELMILKRIEGHRDQVVTLTESEINEMLGAIDERRKLALQA